MGKLKTEVGISTLFENKRSPLTFSNQELSTWLLKIFNEDKEKNDNSQELFRIRFSDLLFITHGFKQVFELVRRIKQLPYAGKFNQEVKSTVLTIIEEINKDRFPETYVFTFRGSSSPKEDEVIGFVKKTHEKAADYVLIWRDCQVVSIDSSNIRNREKQNILKQFLPLFEEMKNHGEPRCRILVKNFINAFATDTEQRLNIARELGALVKKILAAQQIDQKQRKIITKAISAYKADQT